MMNYEDKDISYYSQGRTDLISLIQKPVDRILEIGASGGFTLLKIKQLNLAKEVVGIDLMKLDDSVQNHPSIDSFIIGNLETDTFHLKEESFDIIIAGDILEHVLEPKIVMEKLDKFLKKGGQYIISLPNICEIEALWKIAVKRDFGYTESGILDRTHLRFYAKKNMIELFTDPKWEIMEIRNSMHFLPKTSIRGALNLLTFGLFKDYLTYHYFFRIVKK